MLGYVRKHPLAVLLFDAVVLAVFFYCIPDMRRPFEFLMIAAAILGIVSAIAVAPGTLRNVCVILVSLSIAFFGLEMAQRKYNIIEMFDSHDRPARNADALKDDVNGMNPALGIAAPVPDNAVPEQRAQYFAGDIFAGMDRKRLWVDSTRSSSKLGVVEALKDPYRDGPPLGRELAPDNRIRHYRKLLPDGTMVFDGACTTNSQGFRVTRGDDKADETYIFLGCSMTFGYALNDDQTMPHYFSGEFGFEKRVLNFAVSNYGPHQALRELELNYHAGRAGVNPAGVRRVFYVLIDDHARRVVFPEFAAAPRFEMENGKLKDLGTFMDSPILGRFSLMMARSRVYPVLKERLLTKMGAYSAEYRWELTHAILAEMDKLCRKRYGVGLTVIYWGEDPDVKKRIADNGMALLLVSDAFKNGRRDGEAYSLPTDGHPTAYANYLLGRYVYSRTQRESEVDKTKN